jgi:hypothetical protein
MLDASRIDEFRTFLVARAGGYLRNPIRDRYATCAVCTTPVDGYMRCMRCNDQHAAFGADLADTVAPLTYAVGGQQAAYMMRGYKATRAVREHEVVVTTLTWLGLSLHTACAGKRVGVPVTHWATVPSLPATQSQHPFHHIVSKSPPPTREVVLAAVPNVSAPRDVSRGHFTTPTALPTGSHVLLMDDTWATGGHAQSAAITLRQSGATKVSIMVIARWINGKFGSNERFIRERLIADYDPMICPWTGTACP